MISAVVISAVVLFEAEDDDYGTYGTFELEEPVITESAVCMILSFVKTFAG